MNENENEIMQSGLGIKFEYKDGFGPDSFNKRQKVLWENFQEVIWQVPFVETVVKLRKIYHIPIGGFNHNREEERWEKRADIISQLGLMNDVGKICKDYSLQGFDFHSIIYNIVIYNKAVLTNIRRSQDLAYYYKVAPATVIGAFELISIRDFTGEKEVPDKDRYIQEVESTWPVAIVISPYASKRNLLDFINNKKNWELINTYQNKHKDPKIRIGHAREKDEWLQARDYLIDYYSREGLSSTKIREKLDVKYDTFDDKEVPQDKLNKYLLDESEIRTIIRDKERSRGRV